MNTKKKEKYIIENGDVFEVDNGCLFNKTSTHRNMIVAYYLRAGKYVKVKIEEVERGRKKN